MKALARAVVDAMAFLELSEYPAVDDDAAVQAMEMLSADLRRCTPREKAALREVLAEYVASTRGKARAFYQSFMADAGLEPQAPRRKGATAGGGRKSKAQRKPAGGVAAADLKLLRRQLDFTSKSGDAKVVAGLLDRSPALVNMKFPDGSRPLHGAAMWGYDGIIRELLARGADVNVRDRARRTPLHRAAVNGHRRACELLLEAGAEVNARDAEGLTPLDATEQFVPENAAKVRGVLRKHGGKRTR